MTRVQVTMHIYFFVLNVLRLLHAAGLDSSKYAFCKIIMFPHHRLLYGDMLESSSSEIPLGDTPPKAFGIILEYMYSGKVGKVDLQVCTIDQDTPGCDEIISIR